MRTLLEHALEVARLAGAGYADVRIVESEREELATRNGAVAALERSRSLGAGIRVLAGGAWGFAACHRLDRDALARTARLAVRTALASGRCLGREVRLAAEPVHRDRWATPVVRDPLAVPLEEKLDLLMRADRILRGRPEIAVAEASLQALREREWLATSEETLLDQTFVRSGAGIAATAVGNGEAQTRSYPCSAGGQFLSAGYEAVLGLDLAGNAERVRDEAAALLTAPPCPEGTTDLVLDSSQLALQIHESCGHATELDRVLGWEESLAGRTFLGRDDRGRYRYGSEHVSLVADQTIPGGIATRGYDAEGVRSSRFHVVREGVLQAFTTSRETAAILGEERSRGCARADGYPSVPLIRIPNLSLSPGDLSLDELVGGIDRGVWMETNRSWSIDQMRLNFDFACEIAWEIVDGRRGRMLRNPTYQGMTPEFWGSCDGVAGERDFVLWGVPNCGKGEPVQVAGMSHGAAPARFRGIRVGTRR